MESSAIEKAGMTSRAERDIASFVDWRREVDVDPEGPRGGMAKRKTKARKVYVDGMMAKAGREASVTGRGREGGRGCERRALVPSEQGSSAREPRRGGG